MNERNPFDVADSQKNRLDPSDIVAVVPNMTALRLVEPIQGETTDEPWTASVQSIIAWRVLRGSGNPDDPGEAVPVCYDPPGTDWAILEPDGKVCIPYDASFISIAEWLTEVRGREAARALQIGAGDIRAMMRNIRADPRIARTAPTEGDMP